MSDLEYAIASLEGRIYAGKSHNGGYIHVPQKEAETILELLMKQRDANKCKYCGRDMENNWAWCPWCGRTVQYK